MSDNKTDVYFQQLNHVLKNHDRAIPCLLIDLDRLDKNVATLKDHIQADTHFRIVVKSCFGLNLSFYAAINSCFSVN